MTKHTREAIPSWVLFASIGVVLFCCRHDPPTVPGGTAIESTSATPQPSASSSAEASRWSIGELGQLKRHGDARRASSAHSGRYEIEVSSSSPELYASKSTATQGFVICVEHSLKAAPNTAAKPMAELLTCMRKEAPGYAPDDGDWRFAVARTGTPQWLREGHLEECAECHRTAPNDYRFGP